MPAKKGLDNELYPPETAGRVMTNRVPVASPDATVADIERILLQQASHFESMGYIYIVDGGHKLVGVISVREVFRCPQKTPISQVMVKDLIAVLPQTDQERLAHLAMEYEIKAVPVNDPEGRFLGAVLPDTILKILYHELSEDMLRLAGIKRAAAMFDNVLAVPLVKSVEHRLPWLLIGLLGGILAAKIVGWFEVTLARNLILAAFIPLMVYMADAVGTQMEAFIIRDLAVNPAIDFSRYFLRQLTIITIIGLVTGTILFFLALTLYGELRIALVLSISLFIAILSSVVTGLFIPYLLARWRWDPANASGPLATIVQDILSVFIFFVIASWLL